MRSALLESVFCGPDCSPPPAAPPPPPDGSSGHRRCLWPPSGCRRGERLNRRQRRRGSDEVMAADSAHGRRDGLPPAVGVPSERGRRRRRRGGGGGVSRNGAGFSGRVLDSESHLSARLPAEKMPFSSRQSVFTSRKGRTYL